MRNVEKQNNEWERQSLAHCVRKYTHKTEKCRSDKQFFEEKSLLIREYENYGKSQNPNHFAAPKIINPKIGEKLYKQRIT